MYNEVLPSVKSHDPLCGLVILISVIQLVGLEHKHLSRHLLLVIRTATEIISNFKYEILQIRLRP